jgi:hypothetical protein
MGVGGGGGENGRGGGGENEVGGAEGRRGDKTHER